MGTKALRRFDTIQQHGLTTRRTNVAIPVRLLAHRLDRVSPARWMDQKLERLRPFSARYTMPNMDCR